MTIPGPLEAGPVGGAIPLDIEPPIHDPDDARLLPAGAGVQLVDGRTRRRGGLVGHRGGRERPRRRLPARACDAEAGRAATRESRAGDEPGTATTRTATAAAAAMAARRWAGRAGAMRRSVSMSATPVRTDARIAAVSPRADLLGRKTAARREAKRPARKRRRGSGAQAARCSRRMRRWGAGQAVRQIVVESLSDERADRAHDRGLPRRNSG